MIDKLLDALNCEELSDWGVILLGVSGIPGVAGRLSRSIVADFANNELERIAIDDPILDLVVEVATNGGETSNEIREKLENICEAMKVNLAKSNRKWRFVSLRNTLADIDVDPIYGLIKLSEFWVAWEWPSDIPVSMRSDNKISPEEYHSQQNYQYVIENHREWLEVELACLH